MAIHLSCVVCLKNQLFQMMLMMTLGVICVWACDLPHSLSLQVPIGATCSTWWLMGWPGYYSLGCGRLSFSSDCLLLLLLFASP